MDFRFASDWTDIRKDDERVTGGGGEGDPIGVDLLPPSSLLITAGLQPFNQESEPGTCSDVDDEQDGIPHRGGSL